jgi:hypothetical protein
MGCGCTSGHGAHLAGSGGQKDTRVFLSTQSDADFLQSLQPWELPDKQRLLAFRRHLQDGKFERNEHFECLVRMQGVPPRYRWMAWKALSGWVDIYQPGTFDRVRSREQNQQVVDSIAKDLRRTFPGRDDFDDTKQRQLAEVCEAYAVLDPATGYVQGMNFIAGFLLLVSHSSEDVFFMFYQIMVRYSACLLFQEGLPLLKLHSFQFWALLEMLLPDVRDHFVKNCIMPELFVTKWFLTLFAHVIRPEPEIMVGGKRRGTSETTVSFVSRIFDLVLVDGLQATILVALAIVKILRPRLLAADTEAVIELLAFKGSTELLPAGHAVAATVLGLQAAGSGSALHQLPLLKSTWAQENPSDAAALEETEAALLAYIERRQLPIDSPCNEKSNLTFATPPLVNPEACERSDLAHNGDNAPDDAPIRSDSSIEQDSCRNEVATPPISPIKKRLMPLAPLPPLKASGTAIVEPGKVLIPGSV